MFFQSLKGKNQELLRQRVQAALFHRPALHYRTAQGIAVDIEMEGQV